MPAKKIISINHLTGTRYTHTANKYIALPVSMFVPHTSIKFAVTAVHSWNASIYTFKHLTFISNM